MLANHRLSRASPPPGTGGPWCGWRLPAPATAIPQRPDSGTSPGDRGFSWAAQWVLPGKKPVRGLRGPHFLSRKAGIFLVISFRFQRANSKMPPLGGSQVTRAKQRRNQARPWFRLIVRDSSASASCPGGALAVSRSRGRCGSVQAATSRQSSPAVPWQRPGHADGVDLSRPQRPGNRPRRCPDIVPAMRTVWICPGRSVPAIVPGGTLAASRPCGRGGAVQAAAPRPPAPAVPWQRPGHADGVELSRPQRPNNPV